MLLGEDLPAPEEICPPVAPRGGDRPLGATWRGFAWGEGAGDGEVAGTGGGATGAGGGGCRAWADGEG
jgi:hypothetical protein